MTRLGGVLLPLAAIFRKQVRHMFRYPGEFIFVLIIPYFLTGMVFAMGASVAGGNANANFTANTGSSLPPFVYLIIGAGVWMISWIVLEGIGTSLRDEQIKGTLEQNFLAPINRFLLLVGTAMAQIIITLIIFASVIAATVLVLVPGSALGLVEALAVLLIGLIPLFGIGFVFAALVVRFKEPYAFTQVANILFGVVTGTFYSVTFLPWWVQSISGSIPQTLVVQDMRLIIESANNLFSAIGTILILLVMAVVYPFLGYSFFKLFEKRAKIHGDLSKF